MGLLFISNIEESRSAMFRYGNFPNDFASESNKPAH